MIQTPFLGYRSAVGLAQTDPQFGATRKGLTQKAITEAFAAQQITLKPEQAKAIKDQVAQGIELVRQYPGGNSQIGINAVNIGAALGFNMVQDGSVKGRIEAALKELAKTAPSTQPHGRPEPAKVPAWDTYFDNTVNLTRDGDFLKLTRDAGFSPVKISWEDIGRYQGSAWGNRISDVGIWVRKDESDPASAKLALSVRRDNNFRDKVLMVPAENIKVHTKAGDRTKEVSLPERLKELGLTSKENDANVIVSNQFAVVPVPSKEMKGAWKDGKPPRAAFTFSVYPYGSQNFIITDVIEGSSNAVVGKGGHQLLYANIDGKKAPFTASRAEDRADLVKLEKDLKAQGMDVDVQRYYLIQVPLKNEAQVQTANLGEPPRDRGWGGGYYPTAKAFALGGPMLESLGGLESATRSIRRSAAPGMAKVAIGHGETEGEYTEGNGYRGQRAEEPIRVTVCYFVTPKGEVTEADMKAFSKAFKAWDEKAIWGGSFVVPDDKGKGAKA